MITTRPLTREEADALEKDMTDVLIKHGAELGVRASIEILKQVETPDDILSPIQPNADTGTTTEETTKTD